MSVEIAIPFALDARGKVATVSNPDARVRQHVMSLINTEPGERTVYGDYGVPLSDMLFEEADEALATDIRDQIDRALQTWEPGVRVLGVIADLVDGYEGRVEAQVAYARTDAPDSTLDATNNNTVTIRSGGQVSEVIRS